MPFSIHIENACTKLAQINKYESDRLIIRLCRLQNVVLKISLTFDDPENSSALSTVPLKMHTKLLQGELDNVWQSVPEDLHQNSKLCHSIAHDELL